MLNAIRSLLTGAALLVVGSAGCCTDMCVDPCATAPTGNGCVPPPSPTTAKTLSIAPIAQQTEVWCWAASAEMVLRHYQLPNLNPAANYQCGVVGAYYVAIGGVTHPCASNCALCVTTIGSLTELQRVVNQYGQVARSFGVNSRVLTSTSVFAPLAMNRLIDEIDNDRPVIAGISFRGIRLPNISQHAVVVVGYDARGTTPEVILNDPFPYTVYFPQQNPYLVSGGRMLQPGRYQISYQTFVNEFTWANTIYNIR